MTAIAIPVTAITAGILGLNHVRLSLAVVRLRQRFKVSIGDGGHEPLQRAIRAQGNASEYVPLALILLACLELNQAPLWSLVLVAIAFVAGRILHAIGIADASSSFRARVGGMQLTLVSILVAAIANLAWLVWSYLLQG